MFAAQKDSWCEVGEVLACDDRVIALCTTMHGTDNDHSRSVKITYGAVAVIENGLVRRLDRYEPDDRPAMMSRYAELANAGENAQLDRITGSDVRDQEPRS